MSLEEEGHVIPELDKQPDLFPDLVFYYSAFQQLSTSRNSGMSIGYIPYSEISSFLDEERIFNSSERQETRKWITFIDREFVKLQTSKSEAKQKATAKTRPKR